MGVVAFVPFQLDRDLGERGIAAAHGAADDERRLGRGRWRPDAIGRSGKRRGRLRRSAAARREPECEACREEAACPR